MFIILSYSFLGKKAKALIRSASAGSHIFSFIKTGWLPQPCFFKARHGEEANLSGKILKLLRILAKQN